MKIKHIWSILCKESVINQDDNLISIHGALEELKVKINEREKLPEVIPVNLNYEIVSYWFKEGKDELVKAEVKYKLLSPEGKELLTPPTHPIELPVKIRRFRSRMKIAGLPITKEGVYIFEIRIKEEGTKDFMLVSELPLEVKFEKATLKN